MLLFCTDDVACLLLDAVLKGWVFFPFKMLNLCKLDIISPNQRKEWAFWCLLLLPMPTSVYDYSKLTSNISATIQSLNKWHIALETANFPFKMMAFWSRNVDRIRVQSSMSGIFLHVKWDWRFHHVCGLAIIRSQVKTLILWVETKEYEVNMGIDHKITTFVNKSDWLILLNVLEK